MNYFQGKDVTHLTRSQMQKAFFSRCQQYKYKYVTVHVDQYDFTVTKIM
jgi:hypothetical protein